MHRTIRLIRPEPQFGSRGPGNGIRALVQALRDHGLPEWLKLGGQMEADDIPWLWCWVDKPQALFCELSQHPYILGPCVFFENHEQLGEGYLERPLLDGRFCRMIFSDSPWYAELIMRNMGKQNDAAIATWPFPIAPIPSGPLADRPNLLIYEKSGIRPALTSKLRRWFAPTITIGFGDYEREELAAAARSSWGCAYLSQSDRGPLALAEIMLSGCPAVGIPHGAPWIEDGATGYLVAEKAKPEQWRELLGKAKELDPNRVRERAVERFSAAAVVPQVLKALEHVAQTA